MDQSPQDISTATFPIVKKGYDPAEVRAYLHSVSRALEASQQQAAAMEARARAAVAKLQELTQAAAESPSAAPPAATTDESETISRTLLLAQRTADTLIAEARAEADTMVSAARAEATNLVGEAQRQAEVAVEDAKAEGRRAHEAERTKAEGDVQALLARRDFLLGDVEQLEGFAETHRQRLRDLADALRSSVDQQLPELRRPLLSAAADTPIPGRTGDTAPDGAEAADDAGPPEDAPDAGDTPAEPGAERTPSADPPTEPIGAVVPGAADPDADAPTTPMASPEPSLLDFDAREP